LAKILESLKELALIMNLIRNFF